MYDGLDHMVENASILSICARDEDLFESQCLEVMVKNMSILDKNN